MDFRDSIDPQSNEFWLEFMREAAEAAVNIAGQLRSGPTPPSVAYVAMLMLVADAVTDPLLKVTEDDAITVLKFLVSQGEKTPPTGIARTGHEH